MDLHSEQFELSLDRFLEKAESQGVDGVLTTSSMGALARLWNGQTVSGFSTSLEGQVADRDSNAHPKFIDRFRIHAVLGQGGFGTVYLAEEIPSKQRVALKLLHRNQEPHRDQFLREAFLLSQLKHPSMVSCLEFGHAGGQPFYVMDYVEGISFAKLIAALRTEFAIQRKTIDALFSFPVLTRQHGLGAERYGTFVLRVALSIARALAYLHSQGTLHGDIKPANILIDKDGNPRLSDFGLADRVGSVNDDKLAGTYPYLAPEQIQQRERTAQTDIFSFGATFYEAFSLQRAFLGDSREAVLTSILTASPLMLQERISSFPRDLSFVLAKCLARDKAQRYRSAEALVLDLEACVEGKTPPSFVALKTRKTSRQTGNWKSVSVLGISVVLLGLAGFHSQSPSTSPQQGTKLSQHRKVLEKLIPSKPQEQPVLSQEISSSVRANKPFATVPSKPSALPPTFENRIVEQVKQEEKDQTPVVRNDGVLAPPTPKATSQDWIGFLVSTRNATYLLIELRVSNGFSLRQAIEGLQTPLRPDQKANHIGYPVGGIEKSFFAYRVMGKKGELSHVEYFGDHGYDWLRSEIRSGVMLGEVSWDRPAWSSIQNPVDLFQCKVRESKKQGKQSARYELQSPSN